MKILIAEPSDYSEEALEIYQRHGEVVLGCKDRTELLELAPMVEVIVLRLGYTLDVEFFECAKTLRYIVTPTTGLTHISVRIAADRGIKILSLKGETAFLSTITPTAELTWALLLSLVRRVPQASANVLGGAWHRDSFQGVELYGKTLGIVGYGRLGRMVARYGLAFGMRVIAADPDPLPLEAEVELVEHSQLYAEADVISVHVALTERTRGMIGRDEFARFKQGAVLVNTARGELLDEIALLEVLESGKLAGASLDVLCGEQPDASDWMSENGLIQYAKTHTNLMITPHIGGACPNAMRRTESFMAEKFENYVRGQDE